MPDHLNNYAKLGIGYPLSRKLVLALSSKLVYRSLIKNYAYDPQSEGPRDWYADQLLRRHPQQRRITEKFADRFAANTENTRYWGYQEHTFHVAGRLHRRGTLSARPIIDRFRSINDPAEQDLTGHEVLLSLGEAGRTAYAEHLGAVIRLNSEDELPQYLSPKKRKRLLRLLEPGKQHSADYRQYLRYLRDYQPPDYSNRPPRFANYQVYLDSIYQKRYVGRSTRFFGSLRPKELRDLRRRVHTAGVTEDALIGLLAPFQFRPYPGDPHELLPLLSINNPRIAWLVADILAPHASVRIRTTALLNLHAGIHPVEMVRVLGSNLRKGDDAMLVATMKQSADQHILHRFGYAILACCDRVPASHLTQALRFLYYSSRCGVCREDIVRQLLKANKTTLRKQLRYDAYGPTRKLY